MQTNTTTSPSLCIPRVPRNLTYKNFSQLIQKSQIGTVHQYREIPLKQDPSTKRILFKIKWNTDSSKTQKYIDMLANDKTIKLVYDFPWYWLIFISREQSHHTSNTNTNTNTNP
jgi:hypothetical protein